MSKARKGSKFYHCTVLPGNGSEVLRERLTARPWWRETPADTPFHLFWASNGQAFDEIDWPNWRSSQPAGQRQLINRIAGNGGITNKERLCLNMRKYVRAAKLDPLLPLLPLTFVITPAGEGTLKSDHDLTAFRDAAAAAKQRGECMWIVKPAHLNRGRGIRVFNSPRAVEVFLRSKQMPNPWVVQKYIENPLLLNGRKFDIRQLVLVTSDQRVYMYRDSYVRTSSVAFDAANVEDRSIHLVNDAVQSKFETYGRFEDANKLSFPELQQLLDDLPLPDGRKLTVEQDLWPAMRTTTAHVFSCALSQCFAPAPVGGGMFELFGLDFMVDLAGRLLLIEVNTQPALARHGHVLTDMIPRLLEEVCQKAVDPFFPPPPGATPPPPLERFERVDGQAPSVTATLASPGAAGATTAAAPHAAGAASSAATRAAPAAAAPAASAQSKSHSARTKIPSKESAMRQSDALYHERRERVARAAAARAAAELLLRPAPGSSPSQAPAASGSRVGSARLHTRAPAATVPAHDRLPLLKGIERLAARHRLLPRRQVWAHVEEPATTTLTTGLARELFMLTRERDVARHGQMNGVVTPTSPYGAGGSG